MARISGVDLPRDKRIEVGLTYIFGIGPTAAKKVLDIAGVNPDTRVRDLSEEEATRLAALEFAPRLRVNGVAPGAILPPPGFENQADYLDKHGGRAPLTHRCTPEDIAAAVLYFFTAPAVTGQILFIDGGQHLLGNGV